MLKTRHKFTRLILALAFATVTLFGLNMGMDMRQEGTMSGCMFDQSVTCQMNYQVHVNHWQSTFSATQPAQNTLLALLVVITLGGVALFFSSLLKRQVCAQEISHIPQSRWRHRNMMAKLFHHILQALSNGRLNPKFYNFFQLVR